MFDTWKLTYKMGIGYQKLCPIELAVITFETRLTFALTFR